MKSEFGVVLGFAAVAAIVVGLVMFRKTAPAPVTFMTDVKPLLAGKCLPCHHSGTLSGNLSLETRRSAFGGSERGSFIVPGDPDSSLIYTQTGKPHGARDATPAMPAVEGASLSDAEREILRVWISGGADWPEGEPGHLKPLDIRPGEA